MREITAEVKESFVRLSSDSAGVRGEHNATRVRIIFDEGWDGLAKKITWWDARGLKPVERLLTADLLEDIAENTRIYVTYVPGEALTYAGRCTMVIDGCQEEQRVRSVSVGLEVSDAPVFTDPFIANDPTPSRAEQLQGQIDGIMDGMSQKAAAAQQAVADATESMELAEVWYLNAREEAERASWAADEVFEAMGQPHVETFNGRAGEVTPQAGDYTAAMVGADPEGAAEERVSKEGDTMTGELTTPTLTVGGRLTYDDEDIGESAVVMGKDCFAAGIGAVAQGNDNAALYGRVYVINERMLTSSYAYFGFDNTERTFVPLTREMVEGKTVLLISDGEAGHISRTAKVQRYRSSTHIELEPLTGRWSRMIIPIPREEVQGGEGLYSAHAEGKRTAALAATASHAEGIDTLAMGDGSHAEGLESKALAEYSHAEGFRSISNSVGSHAEGYGTVASGIYQHVSGRWNIEDKMNKYLAIVGKGVNNANRSNAYTLDLQGNAWFSGKVTIGSETKAANIPDPTAANELVTKAYVDKAIAAAIASITQEA